MKRLLTCLIAGSFLLSLCSCKGEKVDNYSNSTSFYTKEETTIKTEITKNTETTTKGVTDVDPTPMDNAVKPLRAVYGKRTGTNKTYTGLESLTPRQLPVVDPNNLRGLSEKEIKHSFGVSEGGKPHRISVDNQKFYSKYGALCLDETGEKVIYLTFDCGYENGCTGKILDTLKAKKVPAAFFVTLPHVKSNPQLIARMINEGHIVGNHSVNHPNFSTISRTQMAKEIEELDSYLRVHFGYSAPFFRFPEGACSESALDLVQNAEFKSVFWSTAYADWDIKNPKGKDYAFKTVTERLHPGCVLLLHAVSPDNAAALGDIIDFARSQGYTFKSL